MSFTPDDQHPSIAQGSILRTRSFSRTAVLILLVVQFCLLSWNCVIHSPVVDEIGHLAGGVYVWRLGRYDVYRVNPPLVRVVAAAPAVFFGIREDWSDYESGPLSRPEWKMGRALENANGRTILRYYVLGRLACVWFSVLGTLICWKWSQALFGDTAGLLSAVLWSLNPLILGWGATFTPDVAMATLGIWAHYRFWLWLRDGSRRNAVLASLSLAAALMSKLTWVILFVEWPVMWGLFRGISLKTVAARSTGQGRQAMMLAAILLGGLYGLNCGYGFEGSFTRLGDYTFVCDELSGRKSLPDDPMPQGNFTGGNRFRGTPLEFVPVPFPRDYLLGLDLQKRDFEQRKWSYLLGEHRFGGWWYYYIVGLLLRVPAGTLGLGVLAACLAWRHHRTYSVERRDELFLIVPMLMLFMLISSETGFSRYLRYVIGVLPFAFILIGRAGILLERGKGSSWLIAMSLLVWSVSSSLYYARDGLSYFNELAGGPTRGHWSMADANVDWGQNLTLLADWQRRHPAAVPLVLESPSFMKPDTLGLVTESWERRARRTLDVTSYADFLSEDSAGPIPGWYAVSLNFLHKKHCRYTYFLEDLVPMEVIAGSIAIFEVTLEDTNRIRKRRGLKSMASSPN
ncbi:MAG: glycosyltransferase family 39 protein [Planctomycetes bacterium]|nr:glycosyltransferase family 39 protein [Planctomycetota bacterium]